MPDAKLDPPDRALAETLERPQELLTLGELAQHCGVPLSLLEAVEREGLLVSSSPPGAPRRYTPTDADGVRAGLDLVAAGVPLGELLELARRTDRVMREVADHAVDLFVRFVRDSVRGTASSDEEAAARLVEAVETMLPATERLVAHHVRRLLVDAARRRLTQEAGVG